VGRPRVLDLTFLDNHFLTGVLVLVMVVMKKAGSVDRVGDTLGNSRNSATERMIVTVVVVIAHITSVSGRVDGGARSSLLDTNLFGSGWELGVWTSEAGSLVGVSWSGSAETAFGGSSDGVEFAVVGLVSNVDLSVDVPSVRLLVAMKEKGISKGFLDTSIRAKEE
jgi:hypothetical protein